MTWQELKNKKKNYNKYLDNYKDKRSNIDKIYKIKKQSKILIELLSL